MIAVQTQSTYVNQDLIDFSNIMLVISSIISSIHNNRNYYGFIFSIMNFIAFFHLELYNINEMNVVQSIANISATFFLIGMSL